MALTKHLRTLYPFLPLSVLLVLLFLIPFLITPSTYIFPNNLYKNKIASFDDSQTGGNSTVLSFQQNDRELKLHYRIGDKIQYPYAGVSFNPGTGENTFSITEYNYLTLDIEASRNLNINISFKSQINGITTTDNENSRCPLIYHLPVQQGRGLYKIDIKDFQVPKWWLQRYSLDNNRELHSEAAKQILKLGIQDNRNPPGIPYSITIREISFHTNPMLFQILLGILIFLYTGVLIITKIKAGNSSKKEHPQLDHKPLEVKNYSQEELEKITTIIEDTYQKPDLSITMIGDITGIAPSKITKLIKEKYQKTFKQLINEIRIKEARRLLVETDRTINDIGYIVGYNNITYFNSLFKQQVGKSPKEYRNNK